MEISELLDKLRSWNLDVEDFLAEIEDNDKLSEDQVSELTRLLEEVGELLSEAANHLR